MELTERLQSHHARQALQTIVQGTEGIVLLEIVENPTLLPSLAQALENSTKMDAVPTFQVPLTMTADERESLYRDCSRLIGAPTECLLHLPTLSATLWVRLQITSATWLVQFWHAHPEEPFTVCVQQPAPALLVVYHEEYFIEAFIFAAPNQSSLD